LVLRNLVTELQVVTRWL